MKGPVTFTYEELVAIKEAGVSEKALEALRIEADKIIASPHTNVTQRTLRAVSGDPHDYGSMGIYWWPNPDTPDGLPYVQRDGVVNPETQQKIHLPYGKTLRLALAYFYFGDEKYREYAEGELYDWCINPETRMNPHARYAQAIPGICDGRGIGLIDFCTAYTLFDGLGIFAAMNAISEDILEGTLAWYNEFINWILTSEQGLEADNATNNHGAWHDAHVLSAAVALGRRSLIKNICLTAYTERHKKHIMTDGSQPHELHRTKGMGYSFYNYSALLVISNIAEKQGCGEYWSVDEQAGVCLMKAAADFLYPYVKNPETFPYKELYPDKHKGRMARVLLSIDKRFPGEGYRERAEELATLGDEIEDLYPIL